MGLEGHNFLRRDGSKSLTGNMAVDASVTIDGVDVGAHAADKAAHTKDIFEVLRAGHYYHSGLGSATAANHAKDILFVFPLHVARDITIDRIAIDVTVAAAGKSARLGIYNAGTNLYPSNLVIDAGAVSVNAVGVIAATISQALVKGNYWLAYLGEDATQLECSSYNGQVTPPLGLLATDFAINLARIYKSQAYGALPDPFPAGASEDGGHAMRIAVRVLSLD